MPPSCSRGASCTPRPHLRRSPGSCTPELRAGSELSRRSTGGTCCHLAASRVSPSRRSWEAFQRRHATSPLRGVSSGVAQRARNSACGYLSGVAPPQAVGRRGLVWEEAASAGVCRRISRAECHRHKGSVSGSVSTHSTGQRCRCRRRRRRWRWRR